MTCLSAQGEAACGNGCECDARVIWDSSGSVPLLADLVLVDLLGKVYMVLLRGLLAVLDQSVILSHLLVSFLVVSG